MRKTSVWLAVWVLLLVACDGDGGTADSGVDAGTADAGAFDSGSRDGGPTDAGPGDAGVDSGPADAGPRDGGPTDAGPQDGGPVDSGPVDSGPVDAGPVDSGTPDAGMCVDPPAGPTRPTPTTCSTCRPPGTGTFARGDCTTDADCVDGDNGRCVGSRIGGRCSYDECFSDADCRSDELCACDGGSGGGNACIRAGCRTDADCGGFSCASSLGSCGNYLPPIGYFCHGPDDVCQSDADCDEGDCRYDPVDAIWACDASFCVG